MRITANQNAAMVRIDKTGGKCVIRLVTANALIDRGYIIRLAPSTYGFTDKGKRWIAARTNG